MPATFTRTVRSLSAERGRYGVFWILAACLLIAAWAAWSLAGQVAVYEVAESARLEVTGLPHPVTSALDGQIVESRLELGREVAKGELLVQLDDRLQRAALDVGREQLAALTKNLQAKIDELAAERVAAAAEIGSAQVSFDEIDARIEEAKARARYAEQQLTRLRALHERNGASARELEEAQMQDQAMQSSLRAWELALARRKEEQRLKESERQAHIQELAAERTEAEGELQTQAAELIRLERDVELRQIQATISGSVGQQADFPPGSFVESGQPLAFILPPSPPRVVAFFPSTAVGRVRPGQIARLRLEGFPWTQYGSLPATVSHVASETEDGRLRVEMQVRGDHGLKVAVEHGVPGTAEVAVEQLSPASLALRAIGKLLRTPRTVRQGTK